MSEHCLYRFFDVEGELLYVGITMNPSSRWKAHGRDKAWWTEVAHIAIEVHPDREAVLEAEQEAIAAEAPKYNVVHNGMASVANDGISQCPVCKREAIFSLAWDRYFHCDGTENQICWVAMTRGDVSDEQIPTHLPAYRSPEGSLLVWCDSCVKWHTHGGCNGQCTALRRAGRHGRQSRCECPKGTGDGHRTAHCGNSASRYANKGYYLYEVGSISDRPIKP